MSPGSRGPIGMDDARRKLRGDAGKRAPRESAPDPGDRTQRVRNTPGEASAKATNQAGSGGNGGTKRSRAPRIPPYLEGVAAAEWRRVVPLLMAAGHLEEGDTTIVALYCTAYEQFRRIDDELRRTSTHLAHCEECGAVVLESAFLVEGARGNAVKTPLWQLWRDAANTTFAYAKQLGLTPEARLRMPPKTPTQPTESDPLAGQAYQPDEGWEDVDEHDVDDDAGGVE